MGDVVKLYPSQHISDTLRVIADQLDSGELQAGNLTIATDRYDLFQIGSINDDQAAKDAIFNMTMGIGKLNAWVYECLGDEE